MTLLLAMLLSTAVSASPDTNRLRPDAQEHDPAARVVAQPAVSTAPLFDRETLSSLQRANKAELLVLASSKDGKFAAIRLPVVGSFAILSSTPLQQSDIQQARALLSDEGAFSPVDERTGKTGPPHQRYAVRFFGENGNQFVVCISLSSRTVESFTGQENRLVRGRPSAPSDLNWDGWLHLLKRVLPRDDMLRNAVVDRNSSQQGYGFERVVGPVAMRALSEPDRVEVIRLKSSGPDAWGTERSSGADSIAGFAIAQRRCPLGKALADKARSIASNPQSYRFTYGVKACGGFQPKVVFRFVKTGDEAHAVNVLLCFNCSDVGIDAQRDEPPPEPGYEWPRLRVADMGSARATWLELAKAVLPDDDQIQNTPANH